MHVNGHTLVVDSHRTVQCVECGIAGCYPNAKELRHILIRFPRDLSKGGWDVDCKATKHRLDYAYASKDCARPPIVMVVYSDLEDLKDWGSKDERT